PRSRADFLFKPQGARMSQGIIQQEAPDRARVVASAAHEAGTAERSAETTLVEIEPAVEEILYSGAVPRRCDGIVHIRALVAFQESGRQWRGDRPVAGRQTDQLAGAARVVKFDVAAIRAGIGQGRAKVPAVRKHRLAVEADRA